MSLWIYFLTCTSLFQLLLHLDPARQNPASSCRYFLLWLIWDILKKKKNLEFSPSPLAWMLKLSIFVLLSLLIMNSVFSLAPPNKQSSMPYITSENSHFNQGIERAVVWEQNNIWAFLNFSPLVKFLFLNWLSQWPWRSHLDLCALGFTSI